MVFTKKVDFETGTGGLDPLLYTGIGYGATQTDSVISSLKIAEIFFRGSGSLDVGTHSVSTSVQLFVEE